VEKDAALTSEIERLLPDFARSCRDSADVVIIHQDSFAADYQDEEYALFGKSLRSSMEKKSVSLERTGRRSLARNPLTGISAAAPRSFRVWILM
jgi:hypothetical protein